MPSPNEQKSSYEFAHNADNKTLNGVPIWLLFIDKDCHWGGPLYFDTQSKLGTTSEPGYSLAMHNAFNEMLTHLNKPLDPEEYKHLHYLCVNSVENVGSTKKDFEPGFYGINLAEVSSEAKKEWETDGLIGLDESCDKKKYLSYLRGNKIVTRYDPADASQIADNLFKEYYQQIKLAKNDDEKLLAIVVLCRKLEIGHFFFDGNQRTIILLLNKLLIENHFSPVILNDPFVFDGYLSKNELINEVRKGMEFYAILHSTLSNEAYQTLLPNIKTDVKAGIISTLVSPFKSITSIDDNIYRLLNDNAQVAGILANIITLYHSQTLQLTPNHYQLLAQHAKNADVIFSVMQSWKKWSLILNANTFELIIANASILPEIFSKLPERPHLITEDNLRFLSKYKQNAAGLVNVLFVLDDRDNFEVIHQLLPEVWMKIAKQANQFINVLSELHRMKIGSADIQLLSGSDYLNNIFNALTALRENFIKVGTSGELEFLVKNAKFLPNIIRTIKSADQEGSTRFRAVPLANILEKYAEEVDQVIQDASNKTNEGTHFNLFQSGEMKEPVTKIQNDDTHTLDLNPMNPMSPLNKSSGK